MKRTHLPLARLVLALALMATACNLPLLPQGGQPTSASEARGGATPAPTLVSALNQPGEFVTDLEPPPPSGLIDALGAKVEAGEWTYEEGLINSLKLFTGEARVPDLYSEKPAALEGFGIVLEAQRYLKEGEDPAARAEIEKLLGILQPSSETLLEMAEPESTSHEARPSGVAAPAALADDCDQLFGEYAKQGFPPGSGIKCFLYKEGGISGQTIRVYYPIAYLTDLDYGDAAYGSVIQAYQTYAKLNIGAQAPQMKGVDLVFMILPNVEDPTVLAMVPSHATDERCLIMVYLGAIQENEAKQSQGNPDDFGYFAQTIAHEMFHCFQVWNFPAQADDSWSVQDWWGEGTAAYFSNVVYPEVNAEYDWLGALAVHSAETQIVEMSYDNFAFFQFMADKGGADSIFQMIKKMPIGGTVSGHAQALAGIPGMQDLFHQFGQAYLDGTIIDASKVPIPTSPPYVLPGHVITVDMTQIRSFEVTPFVLDRYAIEFPQGYHYTLTQAVTGSAEGYDSARPDSSPGAWADLPQTVAAGCAPLTYLYLLTSTDAPGGIYSIELTITQDEPVGCDPCLVGTWDLIDESFKEYAESFFAQTPDLYTFLISSGLWRYHFWDNGTMAAEFDYSYAYQLNQENAPLGNDIQVNGFIYTKGSGTGTYITDGLSNLAIVAPNNNVAFSQTLYMNEEKVQEGPLDIGGGAANQGIPAHAIYACEESTLTMSTVVGSTQLPPLQFFRVSKTPLGLGQGK